MNPKIEKYKAEREKIAQRMEVLGARLEKLDAKITELENTDIIGIVREYGLTIDQLGELVKILDKTPIPPNPEGLIDQKKEDKTK